MTHKRYHRAVLSVLALVLCALFSPFASAEIIDDINVQTQAGGETEVTVKFTVPIQYLRHFPQLRSTHTAIYFNVLDIVPADQWQDYESHRAPASDVIQDITVSTQDRATGPKVLLKFFRPVEFSVAPGSSNHILLIHIKAAMPQQKSVSQPAPVQPAVTAPPLAAAPVIVPPPPVATAPAVPTEKTPAVSAVTEQPIAAPVTAVPAVPAPVAPSGEVTAPPVILKPSQQKPVRLPLGGKDGLPVFPAIEQFVQPTNVPPSENLSLAEQIAKASNQAAALMESGGRALLAGETTLAVESFNAILNLPANKYTEDAQLWIGIARERSGQQAKAVSEFNTYLNLYPNGKSAQWVKDRLDRLKRSHPELFTALAQPAIVPAKVQNTGFQFSEFGSLSMYYYTGASQTSIVAPVGTVQTPSSFSTTDQKSLMTNVNMTARSYNNEYENRFVFQDFYAANFLPRQKNSERLGAAYYELRDRIVDYSVKVGRQSGYGGGVMGRFDGVSGGYGFSPGWRANVVAGQLADFSLDAKPTFYGVSLDFGLRNPLGGTVYVINQKVSGITDRQALGGNLRYFDQGFSILGMLDYDLQFKAVNIVTLQGTYLGGGNRADYNFLVDRRRTPILDIRNAVNGTATPLSTLIQNGWTIDDLVLLANQRTTVSNLAQVGMTNHLSEKWIVGTDFTIANTEGLQASGTLLPDGTVGLEGFVPATPSTGNTWTISERMTGIGLFQAGDITNFNVSYTKGSLTKTEAFQVSNHSSVQTKWMLDSTLRVSTQSDNSGGKSDDLSPTLRVSYQIRNNLTADSQLGLDWTRSSSSVLQTSSKTFRQFISLGFRVDF